MIDIRMDLAPASPTLPQRCHKAVFTVGGTEMHSTHCWQDRLVWQQLRADPKGMVSTQECFPTPSPGVWRCLASQVLVTNSCVHVQIDVSWVKQSSSGIHSVSTHSRKQHLLFAVLGWLHLLPFLSEEAMSNSSLSPGTHALPFSHFTLLLSGCSQQLTACHHYQSPCQGLALCNQIQVTFTAICLLHFSSL